MRSSETSRRSGTPPTVAALTTGTIWSPWPPSTSAVTSLTDEPVSQAMKVAKREASRIPAIPSTRSRGQPETLFATWHIASSGFETTIRIASGEAAATFAVTSATIFSFVATRSSRLMPGPRGTPAVITTTLEPADVLVAVRADDVRLVAEQRRPSGRCRAPCPAAGRP